MPHPAEGRMTSPSAGGMRLILCSRSSHLAKGAILAVNIWMSGCERGDFTTVPAGRELLYPGSAHRRGRNWTKPNRVRSRKLLFAPQRTFNPN